MSEPIYILPSGNGFTLSDVRATRAHEPVSSGTIAIPARTEFMVAGRIWMEDCDSFEAACCLRDQVLAAKAAAKRSPARVDWLESMADVAAKSTTTWPEPTPDGESS